MPRIIQRTLSVPSDARYFEDVRQFAAEALAEAALPPRVRRPVASGIEELLRALVAYGEDAGYVSEITITLDIDDVRVKATVTDTAVGYEAPAPEGGTRRGASRHARERRHRVPNFLLHQLFDEVAHQYRRGFENRWELLKFL
jgi:anti-sigma regulatory factor (Ser/Thr protein kinase)